MLVSAQASVHTLICPSHLSINTHLISPSEEAAVLWPLILLNCCSVLLLILRSVSRCPSSPRDRFLQLPLSFNDADRDSNANTLPRVGRIHRNQLLTFFCLPCVCLSSNYLFPSVSLPSSHESLYLPPPGFNLKVCLLLNSHVISCQARRGSVCAGFGFYTELPMFFILPPIPPFTIFPHLSLSIPPSIIYIDFTHFFTSSLLFLMHISSENTHCLSFTISSHFAALFVPSFITKNFDTHCALILIKLIDSTCNCSSCIYYRDRGFLCCD